MIIRDLSRFILSAEDHTAVCFMRYLVDIAPCKVENVRSDEGEVEGEFGTLCTQKKIK